MFKSSSRPLLILGAGIHQAHAEAEAVAFAHAANIPVVCTWGAIDLFRHDDPLYFGGFGTHGVRYANFAVQQADVILTIGTRLDTKATGTPASRFAPHASVHMVDIDQTEIDKFKRLGREINGLHVNLRTFLETQRIAPKEYAPWFERLRNWKAKYPPGMEIEGLDPYRFIEELSAASAPGDVIVSDTGTVLGYLAQAFKFTGQRLIHAWNNTPMGYGLPAAVGAAFACPDRRIILVTGDGGLGVNITEFATVHRHDLNIKTILFNNRGHAMCRQTQRTWLGGAYASTSYEGGLATPDYKAVAGAYGVAVCASLGDLLSFTGPGFLNLDIPFDAQIVPQVRFGRDLDDADPLLPPEELEEIRRVKP